MSYRVFLGLLMTDEQLEGSLILLGFIIALRNHIHIYQEDINNNSKAYLL